MCSRIALIFLVLSIYLGANPALAQKLQLSQAPGRPAPIRAGANYYTMSFGTMNALGIGTPAAGVTLAPLSNGALYFITYQITVSGLPAGHKGGLTIYASTNFSHPAAMIMENCPATTACTDSSEYSVMSTNPASPSVIIGPPGVGNSTVTAGFGVFLPDNNGPTAFTGNDSSVVTITLTDLTNNNVLGTAVVSFNGPVETVQDAVQLTLSTSPGGVTITTASDFAINFGNVNGLGIGPGVGLTTVAASGGIIYSTPYVLNSAFSDFTSTTGSLSVYVSTVFAHPAILHLDDASSSAGPYNAISVNAGAHTPITAAAHDRGSFTRYLGLFVSNVNGATAFTGTDHATLTFTMTVP